MDDLDLSEDVDVVGLDGLETDIESVSHGSVDEEVDIVDIGGDGTEGETPAAHHEEAATGFNGRYLLPAISVEEPITFQTPKKRPAPNHRLEPHKFKLIEKEEDDYVRRTSNEEGFQDQVGGERGWKSQHYDGLHVLFANDLPESGVETPRTIDVRSRIPARLDRQADLLFSNPDNVIADNKYPALDQANGDEEPGTPPTRPATCVIDISDDSDDGNGRHAFMENMGQQSTLQGSSSSTVVSREDPEAQEDE
ncbi:hypothetical protein FRC10_008799 [Ceratobasidium sp. 414]|nr:hypothetical protein FRC10_008799 [Ceratobasidium sp. 414]